MRQYRRVQHLNTPSCATVNGISPGQVCRHHAPYLLGTCFEGVVIKFLGLPIETHVAQKVLEPGVRAQGVEGRPQEDRGVKA